MFRSPHIAEPVDRAIPARIVIGVTGHRTLQGDAALADQVRATLERVRQLFPSLSSTPVMFRVLSPLAEGADRLVVREVLTFPTSQLDVVLPLEKSDYLQDFDTPDSKAEFEELLSRARSVKQLPPTASRNEAYVQVGRYVVDHCDVLIALWDGKSAAGQGGTAEIVRYARETRCPLFWIHTADTGEITEELGRGVNPRPYRQLDDFNSESLGPGEVERCSQEQYRVLLRQSEGQGIPSENLRAVCEPLLPYYARADLLALRYQHLYLKAGGFIYVLAAAAVTVAAAQALFWPDQPSVVLIEVALMAALLGILWLGRHQRWHAKWIDYRFLAERFRSALFLALAGLETLPLRPPRHLSLAYSSKDWMVAAFSSVWAQIPRLTRSHLPFEPLKRFVLQAWIEDQLLYHKGTMRRHGGRHRRLVYVGNLLFAMTFVVALLHSVLRESRFHNLLAFIAIVFPAVGGALGALRTHREYLRNTRRSSEMVRHLEELKARMTAANTNESFLRLVREAEETMLHENEDWRVVVRFHELEPVA
jgi:hypothetical protein